MPATFFARDIGQSGASTNQVVAWDGTQFAPWTIQLDASAIVSGVLGYANGGTGLSSLGTAGQVLSVNSDATGLIYADPTSGTGSVTSVALTMPTEFSVGGSPITDSGTLAVSWANEAINKVFAGPSSGSSGTPGFRSLVAADIPSLSSVYAPVGRTITINGTSGRVTSSAGAQDLSADRSWTIDLATVITAGGPIGDSTHVAQVTYDAYGRLTAVSSVAISLSSLGGVASTRTLTMAGTTNQVSVTPTGAQDLSADRSWTFSLPQNIHTGASPTFAGLNLSGLTASRLVLTDSSKNLVSAAFTLTAPSAAGSIYYDDGTNIVKSGAITANQVIFANGSQVPTGDAGMTYGGVGGSTLVTLAPSSTSANALLISLPSSAANTFYSAKDSAGNFVTAQSVTTGGQTTLALVTPSAVSAGPSCKAVLNLAVYPYQTTGNSLANITSQTKQGSGTTAVTGQLSFAAAENQASGKLGTDLILALCPVGSASSKNWLKISANGNIVMNATGSAVSTSATDGFTYVPSMAGKPTGTPTSYTGATAYVDDTTNKTKWRYDGSNWHSMGPGGNLVSKTANYSMTPQDDIVTCDIATSGNMTVTLPAANSVPIGKRYRVYSITGLTGVLSLARAGSDTMNLTTTTRTVTPSSTGIGQIKGWEMWSDGSSNWIVQAITTV